MRGKVRALRSPTWRGFLLEALPEGLGFRDPLISPFWVRFGRFARHVGELRRLPCPGRAPSQLAPHRQAHSGLSQTTPRGAILSVLTHSRIDMPWQENIQGRYLANQNALHSGFASEELEVLLYPVSHPLGKRSEVIATHLDTGCELCVV